MVKKTNEELRKCPSSHEFPPHSTPSNGNNSPAPLMSPVPQKEASQPYPVEETDLYMHKLRQSSTDQGQKLSGKLSDFSGLSKDELVSELIKAHTRIQQLEASPPSFYTNFMTTNNINNNDLKDSRSRPTFAYSSHTSSGIIAHPDNQTHILINELQERLGECAAGDPTQGKNYDDDFVVAYEYNGSFANCDEDTSPEQESRFPHIFNNKSLITNTENQEEEETTNDDELEEFPLIPTPVLNTPPYEYIFLTKENEAKFRIFLNPKLNQVFQEELLKLKKTEEEVQQQLMVDSMKNSQTCFNVDKFQKRPESAVERNSDFKNQNHVGNCSSINEVQSCVSAGSIFIHCFDPSDVDLELKKIFKEKPPITHRIVRRKSRRARGSSVPAVDSYYGTKDLNKVGHASYFIPILTEKERKAIGWKPEYHYGHWKYSTLNVPNPRKNLISLHPHPHLQDSSRSKHSHGGLRIKSHHHHEFGVVSGDFLMEPETAATLLEDPSCTVGASCDQCKHHRGNEEDTLSFITLSGSTTNSQSCHLIPDKSTLKKILKWLLPCLNSNPVNSVESIFMNERGSSPGFGTQSDHYNYLGAQSATSGTPERGAEVGERIIETLVEPPNRLNSPTSHTHISFGADKPFPQDHRNNSSLQNQSYQSNPGHPQCHKHHGQNHDSKDYSRIASKHHSSHHHHHHGFFHWKQILTHGNKSDDSMSVVGGDVIESTPGSSTGPGDTRKETPDKKTEEANVHNSTWISESDVTSSSDDDDGSKKDVLPRRKPRRLKASRAYAKLLTLADLGYETEPEERWGCASTDQENQLQIPDPTSTVDEAVDVAHVSGQVTPSTTSEQEDFSSSGYQFSGSPKPNSFTTEGEDTDSASLCSDQIYTETRFLDPKDLLTRRYQKPVIDQNVHLLHLDELQFQEFSGEEDPHYYQHGFHMSPPAESDTEENIVQWIDANFVEEIENEIGLLNSLSSFVINNPSDLCSNGIQHEIQKDVLEKTEGQHRIVTLNDADNDCRKDMINDNSANKPL